MQVLFSSFRYAVRQLRRSPWFAVSASLILGFGIGANTAVFSFVNGVVFKPLPYPKADRLVMIFQTYKKAKVPLNYADYLDFEGNQHSFERLAVYISNQFTLTRQGDPQRVSGLYISAGFFRVFSRQLLIGRPIDENDEMHSSPVAVLSEHLWRSRFHSDPKVIGLNAVFDGRSFEVVGVTPGEADETGRADVYLPLSLIPQFEQYKAIRGSHNFFCVGRLKDGVAVQQAQADLEVTNQDLVARFPTTNSGFGMQLVPYLQYVVGGFYGVFLLLQGAVACLLLITCANLANLLLARVQDRNKETNIRAALGANRIRLVFQFFAESLLLAVIGAGVGLAIAFFAVDAIKAFGPQDSPRFEQTTVDESSLLFVSCITVTTTLLFGLLPAWTASKTNLVSSLRDSERAGKSDVHQRKQSFLAGGQVALASFLLIASAFLTRSFQALQSVPLGFNPVSVVTADVFLTGSRYSDQAHCKAFFDSVLESLAHLPGVKTAAINNHMPFNGRSVALFGVVGQPDPDVAHMPLLIPQVVSADYFRTLEIPVLRGRIFDGSEQPTGEKVVIVNENLAKRFFGGENPIGKQIHDANNLAGLKRNDYTIVGVVRNSQHDDPEAELTPFQAYYPYTEDPIWPNAIDSGTIIVRTTVDPSVIATIIRKAIAVVDPEVAISNVGPLAVLIENTFAVRKVTMTVVNLFSVVALLLAAMGLYAILSYNAIQRKREIGVRMALGARSVNILGLIMRHGFKIIGGGVVIGAGASFILLRFLAGMLYQISPVDPLAYAAAILMVLIVALPACLLPAWRAMRTDPSVAIRD